MTAHRFVGLMIVPEDAPAPSDRRVRTTQHNGWWNAVTWGYLLRGQPMPYEFQVRRSTLDVRDFLKDWRPTIQAELTHQGMPIDDPAIIYLVSILGATNVPGIEHQLGEGYGYLPLLPRLGSHQAWSGLATIAGSSWVAGTPLGRFLWKHEVGHALTLGHSKGIHVMNPGRWTWAFGVKTNDVIDAQRWFSVRVRA